ncbi:UDP-Gal or UDP-GlcNAc-dependent glycosyltransferase [Trypanosoma conorhini]|uniref:Hexosyltransferase n=1 Tax=Trypanosoma conorhini TaxID=83891 RepID=A0A3R7M976_9TRYP|nr:UDP-Gal or UDP-GlcNAc-dependent glycosyltransferase [Trypanosoma conorhini]RNE98455.1 UDP-Gal or UDP-GlcNAc-dependent glycosyltransferase [Trypanosoma conorhini]
MPKPKLLTARRKLRFVALLLLLFILATTLLSLRLDTAADGDAAGGDSYLHSRAVAADDAALALIPRSVVDTWSRRQYLLVLGILSTDDEARRRRRNLQRSTCWRFPGVATRANDFTGEMLVLYFFGRHPAHGYSYSAALQEEAALWNDVVALPMNEARKPGKTNGLWGIEVGMNMGRKTYMWFHFALRTFPTASYLAKGDDDIFLRVPLFLAFLRLLPRRGIYMGAHAGTGIHVHNRSLGVTFMVGLCYTLSRDVAEALVSYGPLRRFALLPNATGQEEEFTKIRMSDDIMVGRILLQEVKIPSLILVKVLPCHFHDVRNDTGHSLVVPTSMCVHHVQGDDYAALMARFGHNTSPPARIRRASGDTIYPLCD